MTHTKSHNEQTRRLRVSLPVPDECAVWTHTKCMNGHASHIIRRKTSESIRISKRDPVQQVQQLCSHATSRGVWIIGTIGNNQETDHKTSHISFAVQRKKITHHGAPVFIYCHYHSTLFIVFHHFSFEWRDKSNFSQK